MCVCVRERERETEREGGMAEYGKKFLNRLEVVIFLLIFYSDHRRILIRKQAFISIQGF